MIGLAMINMAQNKKLLYIGLIFSVPILLSLTLYWTYTEKGELIKVAAVQPNFEPHYQKFSVLPQQALKIYEMTLSHVDSATKLIVMPETVLDPINMDDIYGDNPGWH
jgi:apolipoprotein N-acyltransferase